MRSSYLFALLVACLCCAGTTAAQQAPVVSLSAPVDMELAERGVICFSLSNPSDERIAVVSFETPFAIADDHLANVQFEVIDAKGQELRYQGRQVKFVSPDASSFVVIDPHQSITTHVDIADEYAIKDGGPYKVTYDKTLRILRASGLERMKDLGPEDEIPLQPVRSNTLTVWINNALIKAASTSQLGRPREYAPVNHETAPMACSRPDYRRGT